MSMQQTIKTTVNNTVEQIKSFLNTVTARELILCFLMVFGCTISYLLGALDMAHNYKVQIEQQQELQKAAESEKVKYVIIDKGNNQYIKEINGGNY